MVGKLLGHSQVQTTAGYAHLAAEPAKAEAEAVSGALAEMIGPSDACGPVISS
jgi:hypothetical protein